MTNESAIHAPAVARTDAMSQILKIENEVRIKKEALKALRENIQDKIDALDESVRVSRLMDELKEAKAEQKKAIAEDGDIQESLERLSEERGSTNDLRSILSDHIVRYAIDYKVQSMLNQRDKSNRLIVLTAKLGPEAEDQMEIPL